MDSSIGTEFAGHRIEAVIGRGGASIVYLAEHLRLGRKAALKVLAPHLADDEAFRERFIRESRMAAGLDHPNIVTVYDAGEVNGSLYISMRYVEGSDLERLLHEEKLLEPHRAISILSQIASALDAAHAEGLVHRDVKPGNILVDPAASVPGFDRAYLSDFGISKRTTSRGGLTRTGQFVGTVDYVAPEQITGEPVDGRADVYSLGCVLYQCLCGRVPFPGLTEVATIYSHLHDPPPSLLGVVEAWTGVDRVLARALSKDKHERYDTCGALVEATRTELIAEASAVTDGRPTLTSGPVAVSANDVDTPEMSVHEVETVQREVVDAEPTPPRGPDGRRRRSVVALVAGGVVVLAVLALVLPRLNEGTDPPDDGRSPASPEPPTPEVDTPPSGEQVQLSWNQAYELEHVFGGSGKQAILDAIVTEDAVIAVGHVAEVSGGLDDAAVWRSVNGQRWNVTGAASLADVGDQRMIAVTEFDEGLVAAGWDGSDAAVWTSRDGGETWTPSTSPALGGDGSQWIRDLVPSGSQLVAVGASGPRGAQDAAAWISDDGGEWERMAGDALAAFGQQEMLAVRPLGSRLIVIGYTTERGDMDPAVWLYEEEAWNRVDPDEFDEPNMQIMLDMAGGERGLPLVAVGCEEESLLRCDTASSSTADAGVWISDDGRSWERVMTESGRLEGDGIQVMRAIVTYRGSFVAVGTRTAPGDDLDGGVWISADGLEWRAPGPLDSTAALLGGDGDQSLRALVPYGRGRIAVVGFGVTDEGEVEDAQVWTATSIGA
jgi:serine/threonine protein kinase